MGLAEYTFRRIGGAVEVSKWVGNDVPAAVYVVVGVTCDCPAGTHRGACKHPRMVKAWQKLGEPIGFFTDEQL